MALGIGIHERLISVPPYVRLILVPPLKVQGYPTNKTEILCCGALYIYILIVIIYVWLKLLSPLYVLCFNNVKTTVFTFVR